MRSKVIVGVRTDDRNPICQTKPRCMLCAQPLQRVKNNRVVADNTVHTHFQCLFHRSGGHVQCDQHAVHRRRRRTHQQSHIVPFHAAPKGRQRINGIIYRSGCIFHGNSPFRFALVLSPMTGLSVQGDRRSSRPADGFGGLRPPAALRAATCGRRSPCLYPDFQLFRQPSSSKIRSAAASASRSDVYGTSLKRRFPETIAERRRLSFGRYRIYTGSPSASALPSS